MHNRIDAVTGSPPVPLAPVEPIAPQRRPAPDEERVIAAAQPAASFARRPDGGAETYSPPLSHRIAPPDAVAPALYQALAPEPWGHPLPKASVWEEAVAARTPAAPATQAAIMTAGSAAPVVPAWLTSLLKAR